MNTSRVTFTAIRFLSAVPFAVALFISLSFGKTEVPVFLFSGQSNMVGMGSVNDLSADQKKTINSVMINVDGNCDQSKKASGFHSVPVSATGRPISGRS